jgi:hypothetical protein
MASSTNPQEAIRKLAQRKHIFLATVQETVQDYVKHSQQGKNAMIRNDLGKVIIVMGGIKLDQEKYDQVFHGLLPERVTARKMLELLKNYGELTDYQPQFEAEPGDPDEGPANNFVMVDPDQGQLILVRSYDEDAELDSAVVLDQIKQFKNAAVVKTWHELEQRYIQNLKKSH